MKLAALLLVTFVVGTQCAAVDLKFVREACQTKVGFTKAAVEAITENGDLRNSKLGSYLFCVNKASGVQNEKGELQVAEITKRYQNRANGDSENLTLEEVLGCVHNKESPEETAYQYFMCIWHRL